VYFSESLDSTQAHSISHSSHHVANTTATATTTTATTTTSVSDISPSFVHLTELDTGCRHVDAPSHSASSPGNDGLQPLSYPSLLTSSAAAVSAVASASNARAVAIVNPVVQETCTEDVDEICPKTLDIRNNSDDETKLKPVFTAAENSTLRSSGMPLRHSDSEEEEDAVLKQICDVETDTAVLSEVSEVQRTESPSAAVSCTSPCTVHTLSTMPTDSTLAVYHDHFSIADTNVQHSTVAAMSRSSASGLSAVAHVAAESSQINNEPSSNSLSSLVMPQFVSSSVDNTTKCNTSECNGNDRRCIVM